MSIVCGMRHRRARKVKVTFKRSHFDASCGWTFADNPLKLVVVNEA
jgi:hypothetical protein